MTGLRVEEVDRQHDDRETTESLSAANSSLSHPNGEHTSQGRRWEDEEEEEGLLPARTRRYITLPDQRPLRRRHIVLEDAEGRER